MAQRPVTADTTMASAEERRAVEQGPPVPGLVLISADARPFQRIFRVERGPLVLGRQELAVEDRLDSAISRQHASFAFDDGGFTVTDLGSRNGTFVAGERITGATRVVSGHVVRVGGALLVATPNVLPFEHYGLGVLRGMVSGPSLRRALEAIELSQSVGLVRSLMISGESGTGKELAARAFHEALGKPNAPLSAVNCATIPKDLAERLLFGSRRGAFSGAVDATGYVQAADGGTLFLDEVAELPGDVQSKLLRMLETHEVMRLGATQYEPVDVRVCAATWRDLRAEVRAGRFREDLYFRIGQPEVHLPPLRERREEIPWHIQDVLVECSRDRSLSATAGFVEACALREWPGNVRELRAEVRRAAAAAVAHDSDRLLADDLGAGAGQALQSAPATAEAGTFPRDEVAEALSAAGGNVVAAARRLGIHRNKIRRWLERHSVAPDTFKPRGGP
jgi:transcriptional regulator with AAA-type ATPase domain